MELPDLNTKAKITWCPGCPNGGILVAFRQAVSELANEGKLRRENLVAMAGIGCHGKIAEYLNLNTFTSLHGRVIPTMTGAKAANPGLTVVGFSGDGDTFAEGAEHLIHAARRNTDINLFVHDNRVFALTTGQTTPTSPKGFKSKTTPFGSIEDPFEPLALALAVGATFVARTYALDIGRTKDVMKQAILHKGFAFVDMIQPCLTFFDTRNDMRDRVVWLTDTPTKMEDALALVRSGDDKTRCGIFWRADRPTFEEQLYA